MGEIEEREFEECLKMTKFYLGKLDLQYIWKGNINNEVFENISNQILNGTRQGETFMEYINFIDPKKFLMCVYINEKRLQKNRHERKKNLQFYKKFLDKFKDEKLGYIRKYGNHIDAVSMFDIYNNDNLTSQNEMKKIVEKLSDNVLLQLIQVPDNSDNLYGIDDLRDAVMEVNSSIINEYKNKNSNEKQGELLRDIFLNEYVKEEIEIIRKNFIQYARYIDIKKIILTLFAEIQTKLENGECEEENREMYEKTLKELYPIIKDKNIIIHINGEEYDDNEATMRMQQFCGEVYFTEEEIEKAIENIAENNIQPDKKHIEFIKNYMQSRKRKVNNFKELNFFSNYIFNNEELLQMYLDEQIKIEDIETLKMEKEKNNEKFKIISDEDFAQKYKRLQEMNRQQKDSTTLDKLRKLVILYAKTNANSINKEYHINNVLNLMDKNEDIEYLLQMGIINNEDAQATMKRIEEEKIKQQEIEKEQQEKIFKEQLKTIDGVQNFLENGILTESEVIEETIKGNINKEVFIQLYLSGKINLNTIKEYTTKYDLNKLISNENIINEIASRKGTKNYKKEMNLLALYRRLKSKQEEEKGKNVSEIEEEYKDFILFLEVALEEQGKSGTSSEDKIKLYNSGILPIDTIIDWGDKEEITRILSNGKIKVNDIRKLYSEKIIGNEEVSSIIKAENVTLAQKIALLSIIYKNDQHKKKQDIQTLFEEIREGEEGNKKGKIIEEKENQKLEKMLNDNEERISALISIDDEAEIETTTDGHIVVHLPNIQGGIVVIEQLYTIDTMKNLIKPKKGIDVYLMDEYDYVNRKEEIIVDKNINKRELRELEKDGITNRQINVSSSSIKKVLERGMDTQKYSEAQKKDIRKIVSNSNQITI